MSYVIIINICIATRSVEAFVFSLLLLRTKGRKCMYRLVEISLSLEMYSTKILSSAIYGLSHKKSDFVIMIFFL